MGASLSHDLGDEGSRSSCSGQISLGQMAALLNAELCGVNDTGLKLN